MEANKFGYQPNISNMEEYLKENERASEGSNINWWSIPSGMSSVRILPPWDATGRVALPVYSHPIEFQGNGMKYKKYSWTCVNRTFGKPCNICQGLDSIRESGVDVSNYEPNRRTFYFNAIVIHDPTGNTKPGTHVLMKSPKTVYDWVVSSITNPMIGDITSVTNGIDIIINKEGSGLGTTYTTTLSPNGRTAIPQEYLDNITELYNLDDIFQTGFEQEQVNELVNSLYRSSNAMVGGITRAANQMSGQIPQNPYPASPQIPMPQTPQQMSQPYTPTAPSMTTAVPQFNQGAFQNTSNEPLPFVQTSPQNVVTPSVQNASDKPECFGKSYNPSNVSCVTCSYEIGCSQQCSK